MPMSAEEAVAHSPTALVHAAVAALERQFFEPLVVAVLFRDAWEGAMAALTRTETQTRVNGGCASQCSVRNTVPRPSQMRFARCYGGPYPCDTRPR